VDRDRRATGFSPGEYFAHFNHRVISFSARSEQEQRLAPAPGSGRILGESVRVLTSKDVAKRALESGAENEKALAVQGL
jgi:hypothetical protein